MQKLLVFALMLILAGSAMAIDLGNSAPAKPMIHTPNAPATRQGGDTIDAAVAITVPGNFTGTTVGFADNYDEVCPYTDSTSPDVVYTFVPGVDASLDLDMLGSAYDTKLYMYDGDLNLIACNDDFHPDYTSKLDNVVVMAGVTYYVVVDGYGENSGDYILDITAFDPCHIDCPAGATLEGEPPLVSGYIDEWNSGCGNDGPPIFQTITNSIFYGVSGWYDSSRDTDWFVYTIPDYGLLEVTGDAEAATFLFELGPQNCDDVEVIQDITVGPCAEGTLTITGPAGSDVWIWVGPSSYGEGVVEEYHYVLLSNNISAVEDHSLSSVKALFN